jgi:hypothetical protein
MYKAIASDVSEMMSNMLFTFGKLMQRCCCWPQLYRPSKNPVKRRVFQGFASIREAYIHRLVRLDVYDTVYVFDIDQLKRLRRSVVVAFDVNSFAVGFPFDEVTFGDVAKNDVLHDVFLRKC